jgi:hypothetical protein
MASNPDVVSVELRRGAPELSFLQESFPGLRVTRLWFHEWLGGEPAEHAEVHVTVSGSAADLHRHGFLGSKESSMLPACGTKLFRKPSYRQVTRTKSGFSVRGSLPLEKVASVLAPHIWSPSRRLVVDNTRPRM